MEKEQEEKHSMEFTLTTCSEGIESTMTVLKMYSETILNTMRDKKKFRIETTYNPEDGRLKSNFFEIQS